MSVLERIPTVGDQVEVEDGTLAVARMDGRRIDRVRFTPAPLAATSDEGGDRR
jgi:CBS domain containing-hemolysin-like protein